MSPGLRSDPIDSTFEENLFATSSIEDDELSKRVMILSPAINEGVFAGVCINMTGRPLID
jgi:hypothetical protein